MQQVLATLPEPGRTILVLISLASAQRRTPLAESEVELALDHLGQAFSARDLQLLRARALIKIEEGRILLRQAHRAEAIIACLNTTEEARFRAALESLSGGPPRVALGNQIQEALDRMDGDELQAILRASPNLESSLSDLTPDLLEAAGNLLLDQAQYDLARLCYLAALRQAHGEVGERLPRLRLQLGRSHIRQGEFQAAMEALRSALAMDPGGELQAQLLNEQGWVHFRQGKLEEAETYYESALRLLSLYYPELRAQVLNRLAGVMYARQDMAKARMFLERAMDALSEIGDLRGMANAHNNLGNIYQDQGDYENGLAQRLEALRLYERVGDTEGQATALTNLAGLYQTIGRFEDSYPYVRQALDVAGAGQHRYQQAWALTYLGWALINLGSADESLPLLEEAQVVFQELQAEDPCEEVRLCLAEAHLISGKLERARGLLQEEGSSDRTRRSTTWRLRAELARRQGDVGSAEEAIEAGLSLADPIGDPYRFLLSQIEQGAILAAQGCWNEGRAAQQKALKRWQQVTRALGHPPYRVVAALIE